MGVAVLRRPAAAALLCVLVAGAGAAGASVGAVAADQSAPVVRRIVVRGDTPAPAAELEALLAIEVGRPLDADRVRRTLRALRLSGVATEVELETRPLVDGVEARIVLRPDVKVSSVEIAPAPDVDLSRLTPVIEQHAGQPLREDRLVRGVYALEDRLAAQGWREGRARLEVSTDPTTRQARVVYQLEPGVRTLVGEVKFEGLPEDVDAGAARAALRSQPGTPLRRFAEREDTDRLQRFLVRAGYWSASVEPPREEPHGDAAATDLVFTVSAGPRFAFELQGGDRKQLTKRGLLPFLGEGGFDEALLVQSVDLIRADYQRRGFYDVKVESSEQRDDGRLNLRIAITPGARSTLVAIRFEGNQAYSDAALARLLKTAPRRLLTPGSGRLVDADLTDDLSNLRSFYALAGFDRARIGPARVERKGSDLTLVVPISEGPRRSVADVRVTGLTALDTGRLLAALPLQAGGPFHRLLVESSVETIRSRLEALGYREALVSADVTWNSDTTVAAVEFRVLEGERSTAAALIVRGATKTSPVLVRRFLGLGVGDPISTESLLDVQRRLYRLGVFSQVSVSVPASGSAGADREVLVEVEDGKTRAISYGAGYDSESGARGVLRLSQTNLFGRLVTVQLDALVSQKDEVYRVLALQPYLGPWPIQARAFAYRESEDRPAFQVNRRGVQMGLEKALDRLKVGLFYDYRIVKLTTSEPDSVIPRESRNARVASVTPNLLYDRRDDPVDPRRGWSAQAQLERAFPLFDADANFAKLFGQATGYLPLGRLGVLAGALRAGAIQPYSRPADPTLEPMDAVPAAELFYAGGRTTHRAFPRDELGIPGQTLFVEPGQSPVPLGGGLLALINLEWRIPIVSTFSGELFADGGNVWRTPRDFDARETRWGAGVGLRWSSPVGPLRVEIGWKLDRKPWEDPYVWSISLGNAF
jgi:outer membrane protein insertion porin family